MLYEGGKNLKKSNWNFSFLEWNLAKFSISSTTWVEVHDCYLYMPEDVLELQLTFYFLLVLQHNSPALLLLSHQTKTKDLPLCCTSPPNSVNLKENTTSYSLSLRFMSQVIDQALSIRIYSPGTKHMGHTSTTGLLKLTIVDMIQKKSRRVMSKALKIAYLN